MEQVLVLVAMVLVQGVMAQYQEVTGLAQVDMALRLAMEEEELLGGLGVVETLKLELALEV